jgi:hypothetical protein
MWEQKAREKKKVPGQKQQACPTYHQSYKTKGISHQFTILWNSVIIQVSIYIKMACDVMKKVMVWMGIMCQKVWVSSTIIMDHTFTLWWLNMQTKQITVKEKENVVSHKSYVQRWKQQTPDLANFMKTLSFIWIQRENTSVLCNIITQQAA